MDHYTGSSINKYAHCPQFPIHTPINGKALDCNIKFDVEKEYDNYVYSNSYVPMVTNQIEHFDFGHKSCFEFLIKLLIFVIIAWVLIHFVCKK